MRRPTIGGLKQRAKSAVGSVSRRLGVLESEDNLGPAPTRAAGLYNWVKRQDGRVGSGVADSWRRQGIDGERVATVAVVVHLAPEGRQLATVLDSLGAFPVPVDLFVTNSSGVRQELPETLPDAVDRSAVFRAADQGRDFLPLVHLVNAGLLHGYEAILRVSAGSIDAKSGDDVLAGTAGIRSALTTFAKNPCAGVLAPVSTIVDGEAGWGENQELADAILQRLQLGAGGRQLRFVTGHSMWIRGFLVNGLRALELSEWDFEDELGQLDGTTAHALERVLGVLTDEAGYTTIALPARSGAEDSVVAGESDDGDESGDAGGWERFDAATAPRRRPRARLVSSFAPEYHSSPDGLAASGPEIWARVAAARPVFLGQNQPVLPSDQGFYDLSAPGALAKHFRAAEAVGIEGFAVNYYWIDGVPVGDDPIRAHLASSDPGRFSLVWNNEYLADHGGSGTIIPEASAKSFIDAVLPYLLDDRYITVNGAPVLAVTRVDRIENMTDVLRGWREVAIAAGLSGLTILALDEGDRSEQVLDGLMESGPDGLITIAPRKSFLGGQSTSSALLGPLFHGTVRRYDLLANHVQRALYGSSDYRRFPAVTVGFDDTETAKWAADVLLGANPFTFRRWLDSAVSAVSSRERDARVVFVRSWNDWTTAAVLEPTARFGSTYLLAVKDVLDQ